METSLQNHFLVAMPNLVDGFFHRSVVYICEHDQNGAMGLIINRPTKVMLKELLSHLNIDNHSEHLAHTPVLFGGPVQKNQGMVIHDRRDQQWQSSIQLNDTILLTTSTDILAALGNDDGPDNALVTLGYAGWQAEQLEQELKDNSWLVTPAQEELLFDVPAEKRWEAAASLIGVDINLIANTSGHA